MFRTTKTVLPDSAPQFLAIVDNAFSSNWSKSSTLLIKIDDQAPKAVHNLSEVETPRIATLGRNLETVFNNSPVFESVIAYSYFPS